MCHVHLHRPGSRKGPLKPIICANLKLYILNLPQDITKFFEKLSRLIVKMLSFQMNSVKRRGGKPNRGGGRGNHRGRPQPPRKPAEPQGQNGAMSRKG